MADLVGTILGGMEMPPSVALGEKKEIKVEIKEEEEDPQSQYDPSIPTASIKTEDVKVESDVKAIKTEPNDDFSTVKGEPEPMSAEQIDKQQNSDESSCTENVITVFSEENTSTENMYPVVMETGENIDFEGDVVMEAVDDVPDQNVEVTAQSSTNDKNNPSDVPDRNAGVTAQSSTNDKNNPSTSKDVTNNPSTSQDNTKRPSTGGIVNVDKEKDNPPARAIKFVSLTRQQMSKLDQGKPKVMPTVQQFFDDRFHTMYLCSVVVGPLSPHDMLLDSVYKVLDDCAFFVTHSYKVEGRRLSVLCVTFETLKEAETAMEELKKVQYISPDVKVERIGYIKEMNAFILDSVFKNHTGPMPANLVGVSDPFVGKIGLDSPSEGGFQHDDQLLTRADGKSLQNEQIKKTIFLDNLPKDICEADIRGMLKDYENDIHEIVIPYKNQKGEGLGHAYVVFRNQAAVGRVKKKMNPIFNFILKGKCGSRTLELKKRPVTARNQKRNERRRRGRQMRYEIQRQEYLATQQSGSGEPPKHHNQPQNAPNIHPKGQLTSKQKVTPYETNKPGGQQKGNQQKAQTGNWQNNQQSRAPANQQHKPGSQQMKPGGQQPKPGGQQMKPGGQQPKHGGQQFKPGGQQMKPGGQQMKHGGQQMKPGGQQPKHGGQQVKHGGQQVKHGGQQFKHGGQQLKPGGQQMKPGGQQPQNAGQHNQARKKKRGQRNKQNRQGNQFQQFGGQHRQQQHGQHFHQNRQQNLQQPGPSSPRFLERQQHQFGGQQPRMNPEGGYGGYMNQQPMRAFRDDTQGFGGPPQRYGDSTQGRGGFGNDMQGHSRMAQDNWQGAPPMQSAQPPQNTAGAESPMAAVNLLMGLTKVLSQTLSSVARSGSGGGGATGGAMSGDMGGDYMPSSSRPSNSMGYSNPPQDYYEDNSRKRPGDSLYTDFDVPPKRFQGNRRF